MEAGMKFFAIILSLTLAFTLCLNAQVYQQVANAGAINWQDQLIVSTGIGAPNPKMPLAAQRAGAIEASKRVALRYGYQF